MTSPATSSEYVIGSTIAGSARKFVRRTFASPGAGARAARIALVRTASATRIGLPRLIGNLPGSSRVRTTRDSGTATAPFSAGPPVKSRSLADHDGQVAHLRDRPGPNGARTVRE